jgi:hypothetical protein
MFKFIACSLSADRQACDHKKSKCKHMKYFLRSENEKCDNTIFTKPTGCNLASSSRRHKNKGNLPADFYVAHDKIDFVLLPR